MATMARLTFTPAGIVEQARALGREYWQHKRYYDGLADEIERLQTENHLRLMSNKIHVAEIERLQSDLSVQKAMIRFHQKNEEVLRATLAKSCEDTRYEDYDAGCPRAKRAETEIKRLRAELKLRDADKEELAIRREVRLP